MSNYVKIMARRRAGGGMNYGYNFLKIGGKV